MAIFRLQITSLGRAQGRRATSSAAYRAGERIRDERSGRIYDHTERTDVRHSEIVLPAELAGQEMGWARDRATLWNAAEHAESRANARVAREFQVGLPHELSEPARVALAQKFAHQMADRYHTVVDLTVHDPRPEGSQRNYHAHLLATTREATPSGLGRKAQSELNETRRKERGLPRSSAEFVELRARWAELTNESLRTAGVDARVDHRSLRAQGIDREPVPQLPTPAFRAERRGESSEIAERIRQRYQERVAARSAGRDLAKEAAAEWKRIRDNSRGQQVRTPELAKTAVEEWRKWKSQERPETLDRKPERSLEYDAGLG
ncbi:MAG TPA: MobQ family relaxase [Steroidobacteraceae bacterium]